MQRKLARSAGRGRKGGGSPLPRRGSRPRRRTVVGRYMLEMRHGLNNALTSVLGNSDLLLLEPGSLSAPARAQIETIRNMALRIHEVLQRFSSLEKEMNMVALQAERDSGKSRVAVAG